MFEIPAATALPTISEIELERAAIAASQQNTAHGINRAMPNAALAELVVARVLVKERRKYRGRHQRADTRVSIERAVAFRVTLQTLAIGRVAVARRCELRVRLQAEAGRMHSLQPFAAGTAGARKTCAVRQESSSS